MKYEKGFDPNIPQLIPFTYDCGLGWYVKTCHENRSGEAPIGFLHGSDLKVFSWFDPYHRCMLDSDADAGNIAILQSIGFLSLIVQILFQLLSFFWRCFTRFYKWIGYFWEYPSYN